MPIDVEKLIETLIALPHETEWFEFKQNRFEPEAFGRYVSALANGAILAEQPTAYMIYGIEDGTHQVTGTTVDIHNERVGAEAYFNWLARMLEPRLTLTVEAGQVRGQRVVVIAIDPAYMHPVRFQHVAYIRNGPHNRRLAEFPDRERNLWRVTGRQRIEQGLAVRHVEPGQVLELLSVNALFNLLDEPRPATDAAILDRLQREGLIISDLQGAYDVTNLAVIAFARELATIPVMARKMVRIVRYRGSDKLETLEEHVSQLGYAAGFQAILRAVLDRTPSHEEVIEGVRRPIPMIPELALREVLANSLIHQDLSILGTGPLVEIYVDRVEVTNPGEPLGETDRLLDAPPRSRNEALASLMRRLGICEERGSGIDKVVASIERQTMPPPLFRAADGFTIVTLFAKKPFIETSAEERMRACYQHSCLKYASNNAMSNATLRERLGLNENQYPQASGIIAAAMAAERIKPADPGQGRRNARYLPFWA